MKLSKKKKKTKKTKKKINIKLLYFYMKGCIYCIKFENIWAKLKTYFHKKNIKTKKINGPENKLLIKKYKINSYPTLLIVRGKETNHYIGQRNFKSITDYVKKM